MPLVPDSELSQLGPVARIPEQAAPSAAPSVLDVAAAAERTSNVAGAFFDRLNHPKPDAKAEPGFDPLASIPVGYEQYADRFLDAQSPLDAEWIKGRIRDEIEDRRTLERAGGWGLAASFAAGTTDPLTIASMALPVAGETRLAQAARLALISGGTTAAQEGLMHELSQTRTASESAFNVAGSAVLGGILGAAIRPHVPVKVAETVGEDLSRELHTQNGGEKVLGPEQRSVLDTALPSDLDIPHTAPVEPQPAGLPAEIRDQLNESYRAASEAKPEFDEHLRSIAGEIGATNEPILPELKGVQRSVEKVLGEYGGDATQLKDVLRGTVVADSLEQADRALQLARERFGEPLNLRNSLAADAPALAADGYRDMKFNVRNGEHLAEVQINVPEMLEAKEQAHALYEQSRSIESQARTEGRAPTPAEFARSEALLRGQRDIYAAAWERFLTRSRNSSSEMRVPLWPKDESGKGRPSGWSQATQDMPGTYATGTPSTSANSVLGGNVMGKGIETSTASIPESELGGAAGNITPVNPGTESTAGASAVARPGIQGNTIAAGGKTIAEGWIGKVAPGLRLLTSPSNEARELVQQLAETREILNKNMAGVRTPTALETILRRYEGDWYRAWKARGDAFRTYRERMAGLDLPALSRSEFGREIAYAMRRDDKSAIAEVADAAAKTRAIVFEPLKARAMKLGLLPEDVKAEGADSYLTRQYDARKIRENLGHWIDLLAEGFRAQGVDPAEARDIAHKATRNVLGSERGTMDWHVMDDIVPESGRMKERTLKLPDSLLEPYLNSDIDHLSHSYLRSMAPEVEMTERFGSRDMKDSLDSIRDEYARLMEQAKARGDNDAVTALDKRRDADIRDLSAIRDRLYGLYGQPKDPTAWFVRAGRFARSFNALRLLGAATLAHVPDIANVITRYGLPNTFAAVGKLATNWNAIQVTRAEARRLGVGLDMVMNTTASLLGDYASHSQFAEQRFMSKATRGFTIATGETPLISTIQSLASAVGQDELLRNAEKLAAGNLLPQRTFAKLASTGIDKPMLQRIAAQAAEHGQQINGLKFGMSDKWTDAAAAQAFEAAILKDAHAMTLSPGAGDTPLLMSTELGKLILQFKSFAFAASRHVLLPLSQGVAGGDPRAITGLFSLAMAGFLSYAAKQKAAGQPIETENLGRLALEVADKSNLAGWTGEAIYPGIWQLGFKDYSRWSDRDATETLLGPSAGTLGSIYERRLPSKVFGNQEEKAQTFTRSDLHFLRRLAPGQNLWYFRQAVNGLEDRIGDAFDLPGTSNADRRALAANQ